MFELLIAVCELLFAYFSSPYHLDTDGLPCNRDLVHTRLKEMDNQHSAQVKRLAEQLQRAKEVGTAADLPQVQIIEDELLGDPQSEKEVSHSLRHCSKSGF